MAPRGCSHAAYRARRCECAQAFVLGVNATLGVAVALRLWQAALDSRARLGLSDGRIGESQLSNPAPMGVPTLPLCPLRTLLPYSQCCLNDGVGETGNRKMPFR